MFDYSLLHWATFFTAAFLLTLSPGPDIAFILGHTIKGGRKYGFSAMFGIWGGTLVHIVLAVIGISAALAASSAAFTIIKWIGVLYLFWLGFSAFFSSAARFVAGNANSNSAPVRIFFQGALITLFNPKVAIFFLAFLPQFVTPSAGPVWAQLLLHGFLLICVSALVEPILVLSGEKLTTKLREKPRVTHLMDRILGIFFIALGVRLSLEVI